jgi:tRNA pseudouridine55 synthase
MNGVINIYKEKDISSFAVVKSVRRILGIKKCGHLGTLDPMAEGVLPVAVGYGTKLVDYMMASDKEYVAQFELGYSTDSFDSTGTITNESRDVKPSREEVEEVLKSFKGEPELTIPAFSAVKIKGKRAYELARKGEIEDAGKRTMRIHDISLVDYNYPEGILWMKCYKGTYVRSVIHESGIKLGTFGVMSGLIRTHNGDFDKKDSFTLDQLQELKDNGEEAKAIRSVADVTGWPVATVRDEAVRLVLNGVSVKSHNYVDIPSSDSEMYFLADGQGALLAFAKKEEKGTSPLKIVKKLV